MTEEPEVENEGGTFDRAYTFSFAIAVGLILFIAGLVISLLLGQGNPIGLVFGIPLLVAGLILPLIMMRDQFKQNAFTDACPYCGKEIRTSDATLSLQCPECKQVVMVRDMKFYRTDAESAPVQL
ncbi:MAG TPA: hypothetical protein VJT50_11865 [Pyrinomonadaceae bacterium]|nr:hypothetical protein [Pyrinomonadaceae bacterium]